MTYELTAEEKTGILNQHLKNLEYNKYNLEVSLLEINSMQNVKQEDVSEIQVQIDLIAAKQTALLAELASL